MIRQLLRLGVILLLVGTAWSPALADRAEADRLVKKGEDLLGGARPDFPQATLTLERAMKADPAWERPRQALAVLYMRFGDFDKAAGHWREAIRLAPAQLAYRVQLAEALSKGSRWAEAAKAWKDVATRKPEDPLPLYRMARCLREKGELVKSQAALDKARKLQPTNLDFAWLQARIHLDAAAQDPERLKAVEEEVGAYVEVVPADSDLGRQFRELLGEVERRRFNRNLRVGVSVGLPLALLLIVGVWVRLRRQVHINPPPASMDPSSPESVCRYALEHAMSLTRYPRGLVWSVSLDRKSMELRASSLIAEIGALRRQRLVPAMMARWVHEGGGRAFLYDAEIRDLGFLNAFPSLVEDLSGVDIDLGLPLISGEEVVGLVLLGHSRSFGKADAEAVLSRRSAVLRDLALLTGEALGRRLQAELLVTDPTTGFPNLATFEARFSEQVDGCRTAGLPLALIRIRPDLLEGLPEEEGGEAAAAALELMARGLNDSTWHEEHLLLGRLAGWDLGVLAPERDLQQAAQLAQRIKRDLDSISSGRGLTFSVGYASFPKSARDGDGLRRACLEAVKDAVNLGGDRILEGEGLSPSILGGSATLAGSPSEGRLVAGEPLSPGPAPTAEPLPPPLWPPRPEGASPLFPDVGPLLPGPLPLLPDPGVGGPPEVEAPPRSDPGSGSAAPPVEEPPVDPGLDPETGFCLQETILDVADFIAGAGGVRGLVLLYLRIQNLSFLRNEPPASLQAWRQASAGRIFGFLREEDVPGLWGDDFLVFLPATPLATGAELGEEILEALSEVRCGSSLPLWSIGVASSHEGSLSARDLIEAARRACHTSTSGVHLARSER